MIKLTEEDKRNTYGSGLPGMLMYGTLIISSINTLLLNEDINDLKQENYDLQKEMNSKEQTVNIDVPFFY